MTREIEEAIDGLLEQGETADSILLQVLSNIWTYGLELKDIKLINYRLSGKTLHLEDSGGLLGNMYVTLSASQLRMLIDQYSKGTQAADAYKDLAKFVGWLESHGATKKPRQRRRKRYPSFYD